MQERYHEYMKRMNRIEGLKERLIVLNNRHALLEQDLANYSHTYFMPQDRIKLIKKQKLAAKDEIQKIQSELRELEVFGEDSHIY